MATFTAVLGRARAAWSVRWIRYGVLASGLGLVFLAGAAAAAIALKGDRLLALVGGGAEESGAADGLGWRTVDTIHHRIAVGEIPLGNVDGGATGGGIEAYGDNFIYASANGQIAVFDRTSGALDYVPLRVPMDYDRLRDEVFADKIRFNQNWYRVQDILLLDRAAAETVLLVSHNRLIEETGEMCTAVSRIAVALTAEGRVVFPTDQWEEVYLTEPCIKLPDFEWSYHGHMSGGRMLADGEGRILMTVGEYGAVFYGAPEIAQASAPTPFGKLLRIDLETGEATAVAGGLRNAQGLARTADGRLWSSEHGPRGGDEVNLIRPGADYGWPNVSYGDNYGRPLPLNPVQGRHDGYEPPAYSFVPSVGLASIAAVPDQGGFELWRGDLVTVALANGAAYRLRPEGDRITFAEPIPLGPRLRDIIALDDGGFAILTGDRSILLLQDKARLDAVMAGYASEVRPGPTVAERVQAAEAASRSYSWGRDLFREHCSTCHDLEGDDRAGPALAGVVGRPVGASATYPYSAALEAASGRWSRTRLNRYIEDPQAVFPGTTMAARRMNEYQRAALIDYLADPD